MKIQLESHEIIYGDGLSVHRALHLARPELFDFLESFFKHLFNVDQNRSCHRCTGTCKHAITMHIGMPFHKKFKECVPS